MTTNGKKGGILKGKTHKQGGMPAIVVNAGNKPIEVETNEIIINAKSSTCPKHKCSHTFDGKELANHEILSAINVEGGGVPIPSPSGDEFRSGGVINIPIHRDNEVSYIAGNRFEVAKMYNGIKSGTVPYEVIDVKTFNPKEHLVGIFDDVLKENDGKKIDNSNPTGLWVKFNYKGEVQAFPIDGNHRMFRLNKNKVLKTKIMLVTDIISIKRYLSDSLLDKNKITQFTSGDVMGDGGDVGKEKRYRRDGKLITESELIAKVERDQQSFRNTPQVDNWTERDNEIKEQNMKYFKGTEHPYENLYVFNKAIEELIDAKVKHTIELEGRLREVVIQSDELTADETIFAAKYVGYGGLEKFGATMQDGSPTALLYEYYTPDEIVKMMWALAFKHGNKPQSLLEPSVSTGRFFKYANGAKCVGFEINIYSAVICKILHPESIIFHNYFEEAFIKNNASIKDKTHTLNKYDLVIGNPPYGGISGGASKWFAMGEDNYSKASNYIDYFIFRGLDLLVSGGLLIYIVGAEKHAGGNLFLEKGDNKTKQLIAEKAELVDAYKLPAKLFETTGVSSEIIVLRKN